VGAVPRCLSLGAIVSGHTHSSKRERRGAIDVRVVGSDDGAPEFELVEL
jgi:hypothetical protein